jgi:ketosteroid isomerase-like protein
MFLFTCTSTTLRAEQKELELQVIEIERAFAQTMSTRDYAAFMTFLSDEAVFFSSDRPIRGKQQVGEAWRQYFETKDAPFSWEPEIVEVLKSGTLALSTGPVHNADGELIATFTSIWRQESPGIWRIIFDKGNAVQRSPQLINQ